MKTIRQLFEKLWVKVMVALALVLVFVVSVIIIFNNSTQRTTLRNQSRHDDKVLSMAIEGGMIDALAVGNNEVVVQQFRRLHEKIPELEVSIFDFNRDVTFSTHSELVGKNMDSLLANKESIDSVNRMIENGLEPSHEYEETIDGKPYLSIFRPILNESICYHCHGKSRDVLGGMHVRTSLAKVELAARSARDKSIIFGVIGMAFLIITIYFLFHRMVNRPVQNLLRLAKKMREGDLTHRLDPTGRDELNHVVVRMNLVNDELQRTISELVYASQSVTGAASQQASSLQETSASLEEMLSMTKRNAENAGQADTLMTAANEVVKRANDSMTHLIDSMQKISKSSEETSNIIKTIDEIAFQTNLLALNAAVEAARAGEAGAGFAVVADEVRNLAIRAAQAANNTSVLIEGTVKRINDGSDLVGQTNAAFADVSENISKITELISEIAAATQEQTLGIDQINDAVIEIDKTTQHHAQIADNLAASAARFKVDHITRTGLENSRSSAIPKPADLEEPAGW